MDSRLGFLLMFSGDYRRVNATIKNVSSFSAVSHKLMHGDTDVTATYIDTLPAYVGNMLVTAKIGGKAAMPAGAYRYFMSGTYTGKVRTWFWDILVLPKDLSYMAGMDLTSEDYYPFVEEVTIYEGDTLAKQLTVPSLLFGAASGILCLDATDVTAIYCSGAVAFSGSTITTHNIGGLATIPAGEYGYFVTGVFNGSDAKATWGYKITVLPKQGGA